MKSFSGFLGNLYSTGSSNCNESVGYIRQGISVTSCFKTLPYIWSNEQERVEFKSARYAFFVMQCLVHFINELYVVSRWVQLSYFNESSDGHQIVALQYVIIGYAVVAILNAGSLYNARHFHNYINRLIHYIQEDFQRLPLGHPMHNLKRQFGVFVFAAITVTSLNLCAIFLRPNSPHLLTSLISQVDHVAKWKLAPFAFIHGYIWCTHWASICFYIVVIQCHISTIQNALTRTSVNLLQSPTRWLEETRKLEILQENANFIEQWILWALQVALITTCVYGTCGSMWSEGVQSLRLLVVSVVGLSVLVILWGGFGKVFETSYDIMAEWKHQVGTSKLFRKQLNAVRPIRVQIGGYFYADASLVLTILSIVSSNTFNVLLAA